MKRTYCLWIFMLSFSVPCFTQSVAVRIPNGSEVWKKGTTQTIAWECSNCSGTAEVHLITALGLRISPTSTLQKQTTRQDLGIIKGSISLNPSIQFYSFPWIVGSLVGGSAPLGDSYRILAKVVTPNTTASDSSDSSFTIGDVPQINSFAINNGAATTSQRTVTLNYSATGYPAPNKFQLKCSPPDIFTIWASIPTPPHNYQLPQQSATYSIEFWVSNVFGSSLSKTDSIYYEPPVTYANYPIAARDLACGGLVPDMNDAWYGCKVMSYLGLLSLQSACAGSCCCGGSDIYVEIPGTAGEKVEYEFFGGRLLNEGWSFVGMSYSGAGCYSPLPNKGFDILRMPQAGTRDIRFGVRLWTLPASGKCQFRVNSITIRGPSGKSSPIEAFK